MSIYCADENSLLTMTNFHYLLRPKTPQSVCCFAFHWGHHLYCLFITALNCKTFGKKIGLETSQKRLKQRKINRHRRVPLPILCCRFYFVVIVSHPTSACSINTDQALAPSLCLQYLLGYSLNSTKLRELLQMNTDPQGGLGPVPQCLPDPTPTETISFSPRLTQGVAAQVM